MPVGSTLGIVPTCLAEAIARHEVVARGPGSPIEYVMVLDSASSGVSRRVRVAALGVWVSNSGVEVMWQAGCFPGIVGSELAAARLATNARGERSRNSADGDSPMLPVQGPASGKTGTVRKRPAIGAIIHGDMGGPTAASDQIRR